MCAVGVVQGISIHQDSVTGIWKEYKRKCSIWLPQLKWSRLASIQPGRVGVSTFYIKYNQNVEVN